MKKLNNQSSRTKFSQDLRQILVDLAEDSLNSVDRKLISKDAFDRMKSSM